MRGSNAACAEEAHRPVEKTPPAGCASVASEILSPSRDRMGSEPTWRPPIEVADTNGGRGVEAVERGGGLFPLPIWCQRTKQRRRRSGAHMSARDATACAAKTRVPQDRGRATQASRVLGQLEDQAARSRQRQQYSRRIHTTPRVFQRLGTSRRRDW